MAVVRPIYIEKNEGVGSVVSRMQEAGDKNIALVFPPHSEVFNNLVEVKFLKEQIDELSRDVIVVTPDEDQEKMAESVGFKVKKDLEDDFQDEFLESFYKDKKKPSSKSREEGSRPGEAGKDTETTQGRGVPDKPKEAEKSKEGTKQRLKVSDIVSPKEKSTKMDYQKTTESSEEKDRRKKVASETPESAEEFSLKKEEDKPADDSSFFGGMKLFDSVTKVLGWVFFISFVALALTVTFVFPQAQVRVTPPKMQKSATFSLSVDKGLASPDMENNLIPGEIFTTEKEISQSFTSSGSEEVEKKATGTIKIYNSYNSQPQTLVQTTRFVSESGKLFRIPETIVVPGATVKNGDIKPNYIETTIVADEPGKEYNIGPTEFTIPGFKGTDKYEGFYAISEQPMKGGQVGKINIVTKEDKKKAVKKLKEKLLSDAKSELGSQIPKDLNLVNSAFEANIEETKVEPGVGEQGKNFQVTISGQARVFAFRGAYVKSLVEEKLKEELSDEQKILADSLNISYSEPALNFEEGKATLKVKAGAKISWDVDTGKLQQILAGKNEVDSRKAVSGFQEIETLRVKLWPFWLQSIPQDKNKIKVEVVY